MTWFSPGMVHNVSHLGHGKVGTPKPGHQTVGYDIKVWVTKQVACQSTPDSFHTNDHHIRPHQFMEMESLRCMVVDISL